MSVLIEEIIVGNAVLKIKFLHTLKISSITNDRFSLVSVGATPVTVSFKPISTEEDYNTISRLLTLKYSNSLQATTDYQLTISGLLSATNNTLPSESVTFTTDDSVIPSYEEITEASEEPPVEIIDHSLKSAIFMGSEVILSQANPEFYVLDTDPPQADPIITTDFEDGRIIVKLTAFPSSGFLTTDFIKAQRKPLARGFSRWENLTPEINVDSVRPWVYVDFPSIDATPVYHIADHQYFQEGYKYRVKLSKDISL